MNLSYSLCSVVALSSIFLASRYLGFQAVHPRDQDTTMQKCAHTQISVGTRMSCYHDEVKISLPALLTPQHHLLFTFFHVDLQMKLEAPKPVCLLFLVNKNTLLWLVHPFKFILLVSQHVCVPSGDCGIRCTSIVNTHSVCINLSSLYTPNV
jgi:hypothetical protein